MAFSSEGSYDPNGGELSYLWNFGDGNTSTEANPVHSYTAQGSYQITLTLTTEDGLAGLTPVSRILIAEPLSL